MDKIYNFLQDVRKCPEIYLGQRSLTLLYPTLCGMIERLQPKEHCLIGFQEYIASRFQITTGQNWAKIIRFFSSDERHALEQFYGCFDDFIKIRKPPQENGLLIVKNEPGQENDPVYALLQAIRQNPDRYLGQPSITLLYAYLGGFVYYAAPLSFNCLDDFNNYIYNFYKITADLNWSRIIRFYSGSEQEAFYTFYEHLDAFMKTKS